MLGLLCPGSGAAQQAPGQNVFNNTLVSGYAFDAVSGRSIADAQITSFPATDSVRTSQQGLYALSAGQAFGKLALRAEHEGFRQAQPVCVELKAGQSSFGDILMVRSDATGGDCDPGCGEGEECVGGVCATLCAPACGCGETCTADGTCKATSDEPACGANAKWLGGETCACEPGYVPAAEASCSRPGEITSCPAGATLSALGCDCDRGLVPSLDGSMCVEPADVIPVPQFDTKVLHTWPTPGALPWAIAFDGTHHFTVDRETQLLYELELTPDADPKQVSTFSLGSQAARVTDLAATADAVYLALDPRLDSPMGPALLRFDRAKQELTPIDIDAPLLYGVTTDGTQLFGGNSGVNYSYPFEGGKGTLYNQYNFGNGTGYASATVVVEESSNPRFLAFTQGRLFSYQMTNYDGTRFFGLFVAPGVNASALPVLLPGSHVAGLDAYGSTLWLIVGGSPLKAPVIAEVALAR